MIITSVQNEKVKYFKSLLNDKGYIFLDGKKIVFEAINSGMELVCLLSLGEQSLSVDNDKVLYLSENVYKVFSNTVTSQGVVGVFKYNKKNLEMPKGNFLILDELQDPGNVGTLIRSALGAGFLDIYLINCASVTNSKVIRSTMGAFFRTNLYELKKEDFLKQFKTNYPIYICDMNGDDIYKTNFDLPCGIIIGNEGNGVSQEMSVLAEKKIKIPMLNNLESLNAAVSGSIVMYQIANKRV